jgi:acetyl esterase/lipase
MTGRRDYDPRACYPLEIRDVEYRREGDRPRFARVWAPRGAGPFPLLLEVHGGAWADFDRLRDAVIIEPLAATGLAIAAIDFRSSREAAYPASVADVNYATRWLKAHAGEFNAAAAPLGGLGISSGAHLLMLSAMRPHDPRYAALPLPEAPGLDARLDYLLMGWAPLDPLERFVAARANGPPALAEATQRYFGTEAVMREANPRLLLERGEPAVLPPALLVQGAADDQITPLLAERFVEAYARAGGLIELAKYPGEPHAFMRRPGPNTTRALALMISFIARRLAEP